MSLDADFEWAGERWQREREPTPQPSNHELCIMMSEWLRSKSKVNAQKAAGMSWAERWYAGQHNSR